MRERSKSRHVQGCGASIVEVFGTLPDDPEKWADSDYSEEHYKCVLAVGHDGAHERPPEPWTPNATQQPRWERLGLLRDLTEEAAWARPLDDPAELGRREARVAGVIDAMAAIAPAGYFFESDGKRGMETPGAPATVLDAIEITTNFIGEPGHVHQTSIRVAPHDDRVVWLVTAYDDQTVIGVFAALPDEPQNTAQYDVVTKARQVYEQADPQTLRRAERADSMGRAQHAD